MVQKPVLDKHKVRLARVAVWVPYLLGSVGFLWLITRSCSDKPEVVVLAIVIWFLGCLFADSSAKTLIENNGEGNGAVGVFWTLFASIEVSLTWLFSAECGNGTTIPLLSWIVGSVVFGWFTEWLMNNTD